MRSFIQLLCNILRFCYAGKVLTFNFIQYIQTRFNVKIIHNIIMVVKVKIHIYYEFRHKIVTKPKSTTNFLVSLVRFEHLLKFTYILC